MRRLWDRLRSLKVSLILMVLCCWLLPSVVLGGFVGSALFSLLREKTEDALLTGAQNTRTLLKASVDSMLSLARDAIYDGELSSAVKRYDNGEIPYSDYGNSVRGYLERKYSREPWCLCALFFRPGTQEELHFTSQTRQNAEWFSGYAIQSAAQAGETLGAGSRFYSQDGRTYLLRNLYHTNLQKYGMLVLEIDMDTAMAPALASEQAGEDIRYTIRLDDYRHGTLLPGGEGGIEESDGTLLYTQRLETDDYRLELQAQASRSRVYARMDFFRLLTWALIALTAPLCGLVMVYVQRRIVRPIGQLSAASRRMQEGELGQTVAVQGASELCQLGNAFSEMSRQLKNLIDRSYKEQIALRDARIQAMQSRINPHFLNNALESINWQARMDGDETVAHMVETLSVLLNAAIARDERHLTPLQEELQVVDAYFYFVGLRFGDRIRTEEDIDPEARQALVPRLMIQVLVENAVEHGVSPAGRGRILLRVRRLEDELLISVTNDGRRLTQDDLEHIRRLLELDEPNQGHIGIRNIYQRLQLLFPGKAALSIGLSETGDTVAAIRMPYTENLPNESAALPPKGDDRP